MNFKWYVLQTYSGSENSVVNNLKQRVAKYGLQQKIDDMIVPTKKIVQVKKGKKVEEGFEYNSLTNSEWLTNEALLKMMSSDDFD